MSLHALLINENTIDFIAQVNGGVRPADECMEKHTFFVHGDRLDDTEPNQIMTASSFHEKYKHHKCPDNNCNIVELR